jgi:hypothetical protein
LAKFSQHQLWPDTPDSVWCPRLARHQLGALRKRERRCGYKSPDCPVVHRTVRRANDGSGQRSAARSTHDTWPAPTVGWAHRTVRCAPDSVRCANRSRGPTVGCAPYGRKSSTELSGAPLDRRQELPTKLMSNDS